jgi:hypothetical protein
LNRAHRKIRILRFIDDRCVISPSLQRCDQQPRHIN